MKRNSDRVYNSTKYPIINFVYNSIEPWLDLVNSCNEGLDDRVIAENCITPHGCWIFRSYYELKLRNHDVTISPEPIKGAINFCLPYIGIGSWVSDCFLVVLRADGHASKLADFLICQNSYDIDHKNRAFLPHWPQPGIKPRDAGRGGRVENIKCFGSHLNIADFLWEKSAEEELKRNSFRLLYPPDEGNPANYFMDYTDSDVALSIRQASRYDLLNKPASKLVNAWRAEVPAMLGAEFGFRQIGKNGVDYIEATSLDEVLSGLLALRENPSYYRCIVENGKRKADNFSSESIYKMWKAVLNEKILPRFF